MQEHRDKRVNLFVLALAEPVWGVPGAPLCAFGMYEGCTVVDCTVLQCTPPLPSSPVISISLSHPSTYSSIHLSPGGRPSTVAGKELSIWVKTSNLSYPRVLTTHLSCNQTAMIVTFEHFITVQFHFISLIPNSLWSIFLSFRQRLRINAYLSHTHTHNCYYFSQCLEQSLSFCLYILCVRMYVYICICIVVLV